MLGRLGLCALAVLVFPSGARAEGPAALDKWSRYHVNIVPYQQVMVPKKGQRARWVPKVSLVFRVEDPESDDVILLQHFRGRRKWGPVQKCQIGPRQKTMRRGKGGKALGYYLVHPVCTMDQKYATPAAGRFAVKVSYRATGAGKTYKDLGHYTYTVKKYNHNWTSRGPLKSFYVDHDHRMGEAWAYLPLNDKLEIWTWFKYDRDGEKHVRGARVRCFVDGKKLTFNDHPTRRTEIEFQHYRGKLKHKTTTWGLWYWSAYRTGGKMAQQWIKEHPGTYRCTLTQNGEVARELYFEVDKQGKVVRPACQTSGAVRSLPGEHVIKLVFKKNADLKFNRRAFKRTPLYHPRAPRGCPW